MVPLRGVRSPPFNFCYQLFMKRIILALFCMGFVALFSGKPEVGVLMMLMAHGLNYLGERT